MTLLSKISFLTLTIVALWGAVTQATVYPGANVEHGTQNRIIDPLQGIEKGQQKSSKDIIDPGFAASTEIETITIGSIFPPEVRLEKTVEPSPIVDTVNPKPIIE